MSHQLSDLSSSASAAPSRFSLVLLEPGEIYFEDYLVYYHECRNPLDPPLDDTSTTALTNSIHYQPIKGNLKICSKSVVFDPISFSSPLVKFSYKSVDRIELFNDDNEQHQTANDDEDDDLYTIKSVSRKEKDNKRSKCFAISCKQTINCKVSRNFFFFPNILNNKIKEGKKSLILGQ